MLERAEIQILLLVYNILKYSLIPLNINDNGNHIQDITINNNTPYDVDIVPNIHETYCLLSWMWEVS